ncbi:MAG: DNA primase noncatalytic subunit PriX [Caldisphaeraceae archaeon]|nr:DNA primase noncatalytic subunit PriX [Caldisphaeraceae archaeon]MEB3691330.1 DNA primase noncatalytic subunit PriX [Caldisphaeraceae archaeon]
MSFEEIINKCSSSEEDCKTAVDTLIKNFCKEKSDCTIYLYRYNVLKKYEWVDKIIRNGVPDGRVRLILYIIARYLLNVKRIDEEEALDKIYEFINNSCKNYNNCSRIYKSWIINVMKRVKDGKWKPWTMEKLRKSDPDLYEVVQRAIS